MKAHGQTGFTLIELIIAVSIIGILTIIAVPSYQQYVMRTNRTVGKTLLSDIAQREEAWFSDRKTYASLNQLYGGIASAGASLYVESDGSPKQSANASTLYAYTLARAGSGTVANCSSLTSTTSFRYDYVIVATPLNAQLRDAKCGTLCLSSTGERGASGSDGVKGCWGR